MKRKAYIFYGGWDGHEPEKVSARFKKMLENEGFEVYREDTQDRLDDETFLRSMDLIIPLWTQGHMGDCRCFRLSDAIASGVGLAGCHGGMCDAFRWNIEYQFMTGSQWVVHPGDVWYHHLSDLDPKNMEEVKRDYPSPDGAFEREYEVHFKKGNSSPIIEGLEDFKVHTEQYYLHLDPCVNVLATTQVDTIGPHTPNGIVEMPVAYTKLWGEGRVFYTSMGHQDNIFDIPSVNEMVRRGFLWAARKQE